MSGKRVPVDRVAVRELAREHIEKRKHNSTARAQWRQQREAKDKGLPEMIDLHRRARATPASLGRNVV
jgi:uncharacterized coiled-coil DUF342 family protein